MKIATWLFSLLLILTASENLYAKEVEDCQHTATRFNCVKYLKNYDGDTINFNIPDIHPLIGKKISVRVQGIDTPEVRTKDQCEKTAGRTARKLVASLLKNAKRIDLVNFKRGKYFRIVADISVDGRDLKGILLKEHLAYAYDGGKKTKTDWCLFRRLPAAGK